MVSTAGTPRAWALGAELNRVRKARRVGLEAVGKQLGCSHTTVSRWETGKMTPSEADVAAFLGFLGVTGDEREQLLALAREAADPDWVAPGLDPHMAALLHYERSARRITNVQPLLIPGLLQTADYARAVMVGAGVASGQTDQRVTMRVGRRDVLTRPHNPVEFVALIGEHALSYPPCDRSVMAEQLRHILKMSEADNVTVQIIRPDAGYSPAWEGAFALIEFERGKSLVQLANYRSTATITNDRDVRDFKAAVDSIRDDAMSPDETSGLIETYVCEMER